MRKRPENCMICGKRGLSKNEIGINQKLLGLEVRNYFCISCLAAYLEVGESDILDKIEEFKSEGCKLFE